MKRIACVFCFCLVPLLYAQDQPPAEVTGKIMPRAKIAFEAPKKGILASKKKYEDNSPKWQLTCTYSITTTLDRMLPPHVEWYALWESSEGRRGIVSSQHFNDTTYGKEMPASTWTKSNMVFQVKDMQLPGVKVLAWRIELRHKAVALDVVDFPDDAARQALKIPADWFEYRDAEFRWKLHE